MTDSSANNAAFNIGDSNSSVTQDDSSSTGAKDDDDDDDDDDGSDDKIEGDPEKLKAFNVSVD